MRKIKVLTFLSMDGVLQGPGGPDEDASGNFKYCGWTVPYFDGFLGEIMSEQMKQPFNLLLGRTTYDIFAAHWPHHAEEWPRINESTKYVVSKQDLDLSWENSVQLKGDFVTEIERLKSEDGPDLYVYGSGQLAQALFQHDLIDELWLKIFPITLGTGKRLFDEGTLPARYELKESSVSPKGVIVANYKRAGEVKTDTFL